MRMAWVFAIALLAGGCVRAHVQRLDDQPRPAQVPDSVEVLLEPPSAPYTVIGVVESRTDVVFKGYDDLVQRLRVEAAKLGGDAVIVGEQERKSNVLIFVTGQIHTEWRRVGGMVIVYTGGG